jgi:DNA-binding winged helix-turn-helix (wHTH) protein
LNYRFGLCVLDVDRRELRRGATLVAVEPQVFDLLLYLLQNRDRVLSKDDLISTIWRGRIVSDSALTTRINAARTAIGDSGKTQSLIRTFPRRGFRFVGEVHEETSPPAGRPAHEDGSSLIVRAEARASCVLMGEDEGAVRNALRRARDVVISSLEKSGGKLQPTPTDTVIAAFSGAARGVAAAVSARSALAEMNRSIPPDNRVHYRFGAASGDFRHGPEGPAGPAVEGAAALGLHAHPDAIRIGESIREQLPEDPAFAVTKVGGGEYEVDGGSLAGRTEGVPAQLHASDLPLPNRPSIVLLPFRTAGEEREESATLAEGLRLDVQNALTKMSGVFLLAASSASAMRGWSAAEAASRAGVRYVLEAPCGGLPARCASASS